MKTIRTWLKRAAMLSVTVAFAAAGLGANAATSLTLNDGDTLTGVYEDYEITITAGATVTFNGATMTHTSGTAPAVDCLGDATIILAPGSVNAVTNTVAGHSCVRPAENATLTIRGSGTLTAAGGYNAAAIGSSQGGACGSIVIEGGTIEAFGGTTGAGIGSGNSGTCGSIVIDGGTVTAQGGDWSAGIGSAYYGTCGDITISGGTVTAEVDRSTSDGGTCTAAIGAGCRGTCGNILISGGTVVADAHSGYSRDDACAIGATYTNGKCGDITLTTGITSLTATKGATAQQFIGQGDGSATVGRIYGMLRFDKEYSNDGNNTVTLTPKASFESYTVTWKNDDGTTADTTSVEYGLLPSHGALTKAGDGTLEYLFAGWTPEIAEVESNVVYTAVFIAVPAVRSTGGDAEWFVDADEGALRSGVIGNSQNTWLRTSLPRPCVFSFKWKTSSENGCDNLHFTVNGAYVFDTEGRQVATISGVGNDWTTVSVVISNSLDVLEWKYGKDGSAVSGQDCGWVKDFEMATFEGEIRSLSVVPNYDGLATVTAYAAKDVVMDVFPPLARHGYALLGYFTAAESGELVEPPYALSADTTLYAHWAKTTDFDTSDPTAEWTIEDDGITWRTGAIGHSTNTWATYTVKRPCTVTYKWKTSTEANNDPLVFYVDDVEQSRISGEMTDWADISLTFEDSANHVLKLVYYKDYSSTGTYDCGWIRDFVVTPYDSWAVTRDLNYEGATELEARYVKKGSQLDVSEFPPLDEPREGYSCSWAMARWSGDALSAPVDISADTTLYAHWIKQHGFDEIDTTCQEPWTWLDDGSIRTGKIGGNTNTWATISVTGPCDVSFKWKSSSENGWDKLHFYVDTDHKTDISGAQDDWTTYSVSVGSGDHVLKWSYTKDGSGSVGEDCGWVKDIVITAPESAPYTVTWKNADGTVLETDADLAAGAVSAYNSALPTQAATAQYYYDFAGWESEFELVSSNTTYTAKYTATLRSYDVTWQNENGTALDAQTLFYGATPTYSGATPVKPATPKYTYTFAGWDPEVAEVTGEATYTAKYDATVNEYTITWKNEDGSVLGSDEVEYDDTPAYTGETPTKAADAQYTYTFAGWSPAVSTVAGEATYTATFNSILRSYTITWKDDAGAVIDTTTVNYGDTPSHAAPTKASTAQYDYTFAGWGNVVAVTGEATYQAKFTPVLRSYTVSWVVEGATVASGSVEYGQTPAYTGATPTKESTAEYSYEFSGWSPAVSAVTGAATYTATFEATKRSYTVSWVVEGMTVASGAVEYGATPTYTGATPTKAETDEYTYTFAGWDNAVVAVTGAATYTATFNATKRSYTITWLNDDNSLIDTTTVEYGVTPTHAAPTKAETAEYTYTFAGWTPAVVAVTGAATYTATFDATPKGESGTIDISTLAKGDVVQNGSVLTGTAPNLYLKIADGATITLDGASITSSEYYVGAIHCLGDATIILAPGSENTVRGAVARYCTGNAIYVPTNSTLTIRGSGSLYADSSSSEFRSAAIGAFAYPHNSDYVFPCGDIVIEGGTIVANGGVGIGASGNGGYCGDITITGDANVTATATVNGSAGIGSAGSNGNCGDITISGNANVTATGKYNGPGIGAADHSTCGNIVIATTGTVTATGNYFAPGIGACGAYEECKCGNITIADTITEVVAQGQNDALGIYTTSPSEFTYGSHLELVTSDGNRRYTLTPVSGGQDGVVDLSTLTGNYTAQEGDVLTGATGYAITIAAGATVTLDGVAIACTSGSDPAVTCLGDATIILAEGSANSIDGSATSYAGIFIYSPGSDTTNTLTIAGTGALTVLGGDKSAGIGSNAYNNSGSAGNIVISGGTVTATGGEWAAGIGSGYRGTCGDITITGGTVTANIDTTTSDCYTDTAALGAGCRGECGNILISGGTVTAISVNPQSSNFYDRSCAIGATYSNGRCGNITITDGITSVTATKGATAQQHIGQGDGSATVGTVTISPRLAQSLSNNELTLTLTPLDVPETVTITWVEEDGTTLATDTVTYGTTPTYGGETPTKTEDAQYTYEFAGWMPAVVAATADATYTATFSSALNEYVISWDADGNGEVDDTTTVAYGTVPTHADGSKAATAQYTYTFTGWDTTPVAVTGPATYTATFSETVNEYEISWVVEGVTVASGAVAYGTRPTYTGETPTKESTAEYSYEFSGWSPAVSAVTGAATYTATFEATKRSYTVAWIVEGATVASGAVEYGATPVYDGETPTKAADAQYTYEFAGWEPAVAAVAGDATYTAQFNATKRSYTITWVVEGATVASGSVEYGQTPTYGGDTPTKESTAEYSYTFSGWSPAVSAVTGAATYTAQFSQTKRSYLVSWVVEGVTVASGSVEYGQTPTYTGATPTKESTAEYSYEFSGWSPMVAAVTGEATYTAQFNATKRSYTVAWVVEGATVASGVFEYGQTPTYTGATPTKESTAEYSYEFTGWTPVVAAVTGDATYTAQFEATKRSYMVSWVVEGATVASGTVEYGQTPEYGGDTPTKPETAEYTYTFSGWSPTVSTVTGDATYTAQFSQTKRSYTITWQNDAGDILYEASVPYGTLPVYRGETPAKEQDDQYIYMFEGWDREEALVTGDAVYTAVFSYSVRRYIVTWQYEDGRVLASGDFEYGTMPAYGGATPTKSEDANYTYTFSGWTPSVASVTGPATYTATFSATPKEPENPDESYDGTETIDGVTWSYTVAGGEATITYAEPAEGDLVIPDTVESDIPVTAIASGAFSGSEVTTVTIGRNVKRIGDAVGVMPDDWNIEENEMFGPAFMDCYDLETFYVAEGNEVFEAIGGCLYYRNTPNDAKTLALYPCGRDSLYFAAGITVTEIGNAACSMCSEFGVITIPASVGRIGVESFYGTSMTNLVVQDGTTNICDRAFYHNPYLMDAEIAGSVKYIGKMAFIHSFFDTEDNDENAIARLVLHDGIEEIDDEAFRFCRRINEVVLPDSLTRLGEYAFCEGEGVKRVVIGNGLETVSEGAFAWCGGLPSLTIGASVKSIENKAFSGCDKLPSLDIPQGVTNIGMSAFSDCETLRTLSLPDTLKTIGSGAFSGCRSLKKLVVPLSVEEIGRGDYDEDLYMDVPGAFAESYALDRIYLPAALRPATEEETNAYLADVFEGRGFDSMDAASRDAIVTWYSDESELNYVTVTFVNGAERTNVQVLDYIGTIPSPTKPGYAFAGWWTSEGGMGSLLMKRTSLTRDTTYYAYWIETTVASGDDVPWYAVRSFLDDEEMWMLRSGETTLGETSTATLDVAGPCIVSFSCSPAGGAYDEDAVHVYVDGVERDVFGQDDQSWSDRTYEIPQSGAHTVSWVYENVSGDIGGYVYLAGVTVEQAEAHTITFDPQGGAMSESTTRLVVRSTGILPKPRKDYAVFAGWFTAANGGTRITESHVVTQNLNLYAQWVDAPFTVGGDRIWLDCGDGSFVSESLEVGETIYAEKRVTGPCTVSFDLMVDTDYWTNNRFEVYVDGEEVAGFVNRSWTSWTVDIEEAGEHVVRWLFEREETGRNGYSNSVGLRNIEVTGGDEPVDEPDAKRWMVVDLRTGDVSYYGYDFDTATNTFNTTEYKTVKMAFRRVPKGEYFVQNGTKTATMERDYYMAIFTTTEAQYQLMLNPAANVSGASTAAKGSVSWISLRGTTEVTPQGSVSNNFGDAVIYRLNELTGLKFDLPTVPMWEVASLAKPTNATATATWSWFFGPTIDGLAEYAWNGGSAIHEVGLLKPNAWGLYDVYGNVWQWCADGIGTERWNMQEAFEYDWHWNQTPNGDGRDPSCRHCVGGSTWESPDYCNSVFVNTAYKMATYSHIGFRLSLIVDDEGGGDEPDEPGEFRILVDEYNPSWVVGYEGMCPETITAADWPEGVACIDGSVFDGCTTLRHLTLPPGLQSIGWRAFQNCTALETVDFSNCSSTLVEIGSWSFCGCTSLRSLVINGNDAYIGNGAFFACTSLASLQLGSGISQVYEYAFGACKSLATVTSAAEDVDETAYIGTAYYRNMPFSFIVKEDWEEKLSVAGFKGICPATIAAGDWPEGVESIYDYAFTYCDDLRSVEFPASFSRINAGTFAACRALESITFPATNDHEEGLEVGHNAFALCTNLHSVTLRGPLNVTKEAFGGCSGLTTVVVEEGVNFWGDGIFARTGVRSIVLPENMGDVTSGAFAGNDGIFTVYVPRSAEDKYGLESGIVEYDSYTPRVFGLESEERWAEYGFHFRETTTILKVEWIQPETPPVAVDDTKMVEPVVDEETGVRTIGAKDGVTLTQSDVESVTIVSPTDSSVDITEAYTKTLSPEGDKIVLELAQPVIEEVVEEENIDAEDPMGLLEEVTKIGAFKIAELPIPDTSAPDPEKHEEVGALPVKMYPGLYYQASWGDDLNNLTQGAKFRADGVQTHIGVIKQTGSRGFYKISVSER